MTGDAFAEVAVNAQTAHVDMMKILKINPFRFFIFPLTLNEMLLSVNETLIFESKFVKTLAR